MAIRSKMRTNSKSKRRTLKRQGGGQNPASNVSPNSVKKARVVHGDSCSEKKGTIKLSNDGKFLICKKSLKHITKKGKKRKSTLPKNKQEKCYNTTCWHKLSMKDRIMYKSKIKTLKKEEAARKASELTKKGKAKAEKAEKAKAKAEAEKAKAEAEKKKKEKAERNKAIKDTVSRYGAIQSSQKYFNNIRSQAYAQLPPLPSQAKAGLKWANNEGKPLTETKIYNRNSPISMKTQNNSSKTNLVNKAQKLKLINNNMPATSSTGEQVRPEFNRERQIRMKASNITSKYPVGMRNFKKEAAILRKKQELNNRQFNPLPPNNTGEDNNNYQVESLHPVTRSELKPPRVNNNVYTGARKNASKIVSRYPITMRNFPKEARIITKRQKQNNRSLNLPPEVNNGRNNF